MTGSAADDWIIPDWPAPAFIHAVSTTRNGGVSAAPWDSMNPASHTGDDPEHVSTNRRILCHTAALPAPPLWLTQVHGASVVDATTAPQAVRADGSFSRAPGVVCAVMTADCLPLLLCDRAGYQVAALHAGWRGLAGGVVEAGVACFQARPADILAWLGPCIGPQAFEVGEEVRQAFLAKSAAMEDAFRPSANRGRWLADMHQLARLTLARLGVVSVYGRDDCTYSCPERYFSYRRDGVCGRMVSLIWKTRPE